jgi:photosystem II stability/assembly factor-like uncharacterized protein
MSTLTPPSPPESGERHDAKALEALIEEARRRARRRRRGYAALALVAVAAGVLGFSVLDRGGGTGTAEGEGGVGAQVTDGRWRPATGLEGGTITALAVDPQHPDAVFAATIQAGVFKSADGGRTWRSLNLPSRMGRADAIATAPADPETVYVGTGRGVAKTTDGGRSWRLTGSDLRGERMRGEFYLRGSEGFVYTLLVDQRDPDIVYAGTWNRGLLKSTNGGASWRRTGLGAVSTLVFDPRDPGTLYAGAVGAAIPYWDAMEKVSDGAGRGRGGVFKSSDQGESWDPVGLQGTTVHALALDPEHPGTMYAALQGNIKDGATDSKGILKTTDGGANWRDAGLKGRLITGLTLDPSNTDIVYATTSWEGGVFKNEDGGRSRSWRTIADDPTLRFGSEFSTALALDPRNPETIYVATGADVTTGEGAGVAKSVDGGRSWRPTNAGLNGARVSALALAPGSPGTAYAAVGPFRGVFKRVDGKWRRVNTGLANRGVTAVAVDPQDPASVYAGTFGGIYKSTNGGANWRSSFTASLHDDRIISGPGLAVDPQHRATVHAITASHIGSAYESLIYRSQDGGRTWPSPSQVQAVRVPEPPGASIDQPIPTPPLAIDPLNPDTLYAGGLGAHRSVDGGKTWRKAGLPRSPVLALAVDPEDTAVVYAGTDAGLSKSTNAGATWQPLQGVLDDVRIEALAVDPEYPRTVIAGTDQGVFWSTDGGDRWRRFTHLPPRTFDALAVDRSAGLLYAGANGGGIYELELGR